MELIAAIIGSLLLLWLVCLGFSMIIGQRRGAEAYLRWSRRNAEAPFRWLWQRHREGLIAFFLGLIVGLAIRF